VKEFVIIEDKKIPVTSYLKGRKPLLVKSLKVYQYFSNYANDKKVLDVGCGYGHGSYLLRQKAKSVVGIDLLKEKIEVAKNLYDNIENLEFKLLDAFKLDSTFPESSFDIIIALEFIEHLKKPLKFLQIARNLLSDDGLLILSTPNRLTRGFEGVPWNPEHVREFDPDSLKDLLSKEFNTVKIIGVRGSDKFLKYNEIRTGGNSPNFLKRLWRYTPEILKKPVRKVIGMRLTQDINLDDFYFEEEPTTKHFCLIAFSQNK
jgi:SAM-dependent methyltransferase